MSLMPQLLKCEHVFHVCRRNRMHIPARSCSTLEIPVFSASARDATAYDQALQKVQAAMVKRQSTTEPTKKVQNKLN